MESTGANQVGEGDDASEPTIGPLSWQIPLAITLRPPPVSGADRPAVADMSMRGLDDPDVSGVAHPPREVAASEAVRAQAEAQCMEAGGGDASLMRRALQ